MAPVVHNLDGSRGEKSMRPVAALHTGNIIEGVVDSKFMRVLSIECGFPVHDLELDWEFVELLGGPNMHVRS